MNISEICSCNLSGKANIDRADEAKSSPERGIYPVLKLLIENKNTVSLQYNSISSYFPQNTLIPKNNLQATVYNYKDYIIANDNLDMESQRLYTPLNANFVINLNCVTDCVYCYADRFTNYNPLSKERILSIINEARSIGMREFDITGGELFLHTNWEEILIHLLSNDFKPYISIKVPIKEDIIKRYKEIGMSELQISLDSVNPTILSKQLSVKYDYWDKMRNTLSNLEKHGINVIINTILTSFNSAKEEVERLIDELSNYSNIPKIQFSFAGYSLYLSEEKNKNIRVPHSDVQIIQNYVEEMRKSTTKIITFGGVNFKNTSFRQDESTFKNRARCSGNLYTFAIMPDGKVTYCEELYWHPQFILGDLNQQSIMEVWQSDKAKKIFARNQEEYKNSSVCSSCRQFNACHNSSGVCWKDIIGTYGANNWDYPDPRCPYAPEPKQSYFVCE